MPTHACLPALASVLGRSPGKQSTGLFAIPAHPPRAGAFAASPAEPRRGTWHHKVPKTTAAAPTRRSGSALFHHTPASRPAHGAGARQTVPRTVCYPAPRRRVCIHCAPTTPPKRLRNKCPRPTRNHPAPPCVAFVSQPKETTMKGILAWAIGIPIPIIIILYFADVF